MFLPDHVSRPRWPSQQTETIPENTELIHNYFYCLNLGYQYLYKIGGLDEEPLGLQLMCTDLSAITAPTALVAWLSYDDFRHALVEHNLSYGLVTSYPDVIKFAYFIIGFRYLFNPQANHLLTNPSYRDVFRAAKYAAVEIYQSLDEPTREECWQQALAQR